MNDDASTPGPVGSPVDRGVGPRQAASRAYIEWQCGGASGMTRLGYLVMGSVSTAVAARAHCSVEVVRTAG